MPKPKNLIVLLVTRQPPPASESGLIALKQVSGLMEVKVSPIIVRAMVLNVSPSLFSLTKLQNASPVVGGSTTHSAPVPKKGKNGPNDVPVTGVLWPPEIIVTPGSAGMEAAIAAVQSAVINKTTNRADNLCVMDAPFDTCKKQQASTRHAKVAKLTPEYSQF